MLQGMEVTRDQALLLLPSCKVSRQASRCRFERTRTRCGFPFPLHCARQSKAQTHHRGGLIQFLSRQSILAPPLAGPQCDGTRMRADGWIPWGHRPLRSAPAGARDARGAFTLSAPVRLPLARGATRWNRGIVRLPSQAARRGWEVRLGARFPGRDIVRDGTCRARMKQLRGVARFPTCSRTDS